MKNKVHFNKSEKIRPIGPVKSVVIDGMFKQVKKVNPYLKTKTQLKAPSAVVDQHNEY